MTEVQQALERLRNATSRIGEGDRWEVVDPIPNPCAAASAASSVSLRNDASSARPLSAQVPCASPQDS